MTYLVTHHRAIRLQCTTCGRVIWCLNRRHLTRERLAHESTHALTTNSHRRNT